MTARITTHRAESSHYTRDCLPIVAACQQSAEMTVRAAQMVILSIRYPFLDLAMPMADVDAHGAESRFIYGWKRDSLAYVVRNAGALHSIARALYTQEIALADAVLAFSAVPGLGIVKASFLAQLTAGDGACLDAHNVDSLGLARTAFKFPKTLTVDAQRARIAAYNAAWQTVGDSAWWWDRWCDARATKRAARGVTGADVSRLHRTLILGG